MSSTYTIGDFLIRLKNAYLAGKQEITLQNTKNVVALAKILKEEGYIKDVKEKEDKQTGKKLNISLLYKKNNPALSEVKIISKPSVHYYVTTNDLKKVGRNYGIGIVSTSKGFMTVKSAIKKNVGGELICRLS